VSIQNQLKKPSNPRENLKIFLKSKRNVFKRCGVATWSTVVLFTNTAKYAVYPVWQLPHHMTCHNQSGNSDKHCQILAFV